jgi:hypothetical protein
MAKLKAKDGIRGVGIGGVEYTVDNTGCVNVPDEYEDAVLKAGFERADTATQPMVFGTEVDDSPSTHDED